MSIVLRNISKSYASGRVLNDVSLEIASGELVALLGPSGSGKTTLLRVIAGMERPDDGSGPVLFDGEDISGADIGARRIGFVFQHYALFKNMSVFENVAFGLRAKPWRQRPSRAAIRDKVESLLSLVQLQSLSQRMPSQLSGGQRQRVALARALAVEPRVLLLGEPFGALDATVRRELRRWLRRLHETIQVTTIFVTHDQEEALEVSDRVAVMNRGQIEQFAPPQEVYERPASRFVFEFLGHYNLFSGRLRPPAGTGPVGHVAEDEGGAVTLVRPHDVGLSRDDRGGGIPAEVTHVALAGPIVKVELRRLDDAGTIDVELALAEARGLDLQVGETVFASIGRGPVPAGPDSTTAASTPVTG